MSQVLIHNREHNKCLNGYIWHFYPLNELISSFQKVGTGATKFEKIQLGEHLGTN